MKIALGSDHLGFGLKNYIAEHLGIWVSSSGTSSPFRGPVDYGHCSEVCEATLEISIADPDLRYGSMAIAANKVPASELAPATTLLRRLKKSNDGQVLTLGSRVIGKENAVFIVDAWLNSEFEGRSVEKVRKLKELDQKKVTS